MADSPTLDDAIKVVRSNPDAIGIALLQRHLVIGYGAAIELMSKLVSTGVVLDKGSDTSEKRYQLISAPGGGS